MGFEVPEWLTKECIRNSLQNGKEYEIIVENLKIDMPVPKGSNYTTNIYGVEVEYYKKSKDLANLHKSSLIIKVPITGPMSSWMEGTGFIEREPIVYTELIPKLNSLFGVVDDDGDSKDETLFAKSYLSTEKNVVILEDLRGKGYAMANRLEKLDFDHTVVALKALAKFHAGTAVIYETEPQLIGKAGKETCYRKDFKEIYSSLVESNFKILAQEFKARPKLRKFSKWLEENVANAWDNTVQAVQRNDEELNVLNHGDFWTSNMLFRYIDGKPCKAKIIDLQLCRFTSPVIDFIYFIDTSVQDSVRTEKHQAIINVYVSELNLNLTKYGSSKKLKESEFMKSYQKRLNYRIYTNVAILPVIMSDPNESAFDFEDTSMDDFKDTATSPLSGQITSKRYMKVISNRFKDFERDGLVKC